METRTSTKAAGDLDIVIRSLRAGDLSAADRIMRLAFGTFLGLPDPLSFMGDASYVRGRWTADPDAAFCAEIHGELVGSNFATNWGSVGFFGPLTIRPESWDFGVGKRLMEPVMERFATWGTKHAGLFTFAQSQKHVGLYQRFGFWPRFLTAIMSKPVEPQRPTSRWTRFSESSDGEQESLLGECHRLTDLVHEGLNVNGEIKAAYDQRLGETVLLWGSAGLKGFAVCHCGPGTEAGSGLCYIKFGVVAPGPDAERSFRELLESCEEMARAHGLLRLSAGVNYARHEAFGILRALGFRTDLQGVSMARPNEPGYNRPGTYLIDDWR